MRRLMPLIIVLGFALASCRDDPEHVSEAAPGPSEQPVRGANTERKGLEIGIPYRIELYTHCGIDFWTRFDGNYWDAVDHDNSSGNPPKGLGNPYDLGTMTLTSSDEAEYRSATGRVFLFRRGPERRPEGLVCF
jgi:hypothetical protein